MGYKELQSGLVVGLEGSGSSVIIVSNEGTVNAMDYEPEKRAILSRPGTVPRDLIDLQKATEHLSQDEFVKAWVDFEVLQAGLHEGDPRLEWLKQRAHERAIAMYNGE